MTRARSVSQHEAATPSVPTAVAAPASLSGEAYLALILEAIEDAKAEETVVIDLKGRTSIADTMIITSGRANRHVASIAHRVTEALKEAGYRGIKSEGEPQCDWVLLDAGDVIIHIFRPEVRQFYNLEKMWGADRPAEQSNG